MCFWSHRKEDLRNYISLTFFGISRRSPAWMMECHQKYLAFIQMIQINGMYFVQRMCHLPTWFSIQVPFLVAFSFLFRRKHVEAVRAQFTQRVQSDWAIKIEIDVIYLQDRNHIHSECFLVLEKCNAIAYFVGAKPSSIRWVALKLILILFS